MLRNVLRPKAIQNKVRFVRHAQYVISRRVRHQTTCKMQTYFPIITNDFSLKIDILKC